MADQTDSYTETTSQSWGSRLMSSFKGILLGGILVLVAVGLLWWNEGRAVKTAKSLAEGEDIVASISADAVNSAFQGKLVHVTGLATSTETLSDSEFGVSANALRLRRTVLMYQWREKTNTQTEHKVGGAQETTTTYSYERAWSPDLIPSSTFKMKDGHANPAAMPFKGTTLDAGTVTLGAFKLAPDLIKKIDRFDPLIPTEEDLSRVVESAKKDMRLAEGGYYVGANPATPQIGDVKITFQVVKPLDVSIVARQINNTFEPYLTKVKKPIMILKVGQFSADTMFEQAQSSNASLTWLLRAVGLVVMWLGFAALFGPFAVLADVLPFLGTIVRFGAGLVSLVAALVLSLVAIVVAWLFYRPLLAIIVLIVGAVVIYGIVHVVHNRTKPSQPPAPPNPA